ncbi:MAG: hypothetical protein U0401_17655 [Anaerolineae bacterium]
MLKLTNWLVGLVVMSMVIALIFGAVYAFAQTNLAQSWGFGRHGGHMEDRQGPGDTNFEHSDRGDRPREGLDRERGRDGRGISLGRGLGITVINLVKIALAVGLVSLVMPRLAAFFRQHYRAKQPGPA